VLSTGQLYFKGIYRICQPTTQKENLLLKLVTHGTIKVKHYAKNLLVLKQIMRELDVVGNMVE
jgi:hypothetical protein